MLSLQTCVRRKVGSRGAHGPEEADGHGGSHETLEVYPSDSPSKVWTHKQQSDIEETVQVASGFVTYVTEPAYPDGFQPTPAFPGVSVECSGYCK